MLRLVAPRRRWRRTEMGLVGLRHCPACGEESVSSALCWWGQALSLHRPAVQLWSFLCLMAGYGGHLCPGHLVAPDVLKKGSQILVVEPWDSLPLRTPQLLARGGGPLTRGWTWWWEDLVCAWKQSDTGAAPSHGCLGEETLVPGQPFPRVTHWCCHPSDMGCR